MTESLAFMRQVHYEVKPSPYPLDNWAKVYAFLEKIRIPYRLRRIYCYFWRGAKGWCAMDTWGFDSYLNRVIPAGLKYLRSHAHGHPTDISFDEWIQKLDDMIFFFETREKIDDYELLAQDAPPSLAEFERQRGTRMITKAEQERMERGRKAFNDYYAHLWD